MRTHGPSIFNTNIRANASERGAAMMVSLVFFIAASVIVVIGMTGPATREYRTASETVSSDASYYAAESAAEDAYYRYKNSMSLGSSDSLPDGSATANIASAGSGEEEIVSTGDVQNSERAVDIKFDDGSTDYDIKSWTETQ